MQLAAAFSTHHLNSMISPFWPVSARMSGVGEYLHSSILPYLETNWKGSLGVGGWEDGSNEQVMCAHMHSCRSRSLQKLLAIVVACMDLLSLSLEKPLIYIWNGESRSVCGRNGSTVWKMIAS